LVARRGGAQRVLLPSQKAASCRLLGLEKAQARLAELRASGELSEVERLDPVAKAQANLASLKLAIAARCWECVGSGADPDPRGTIRECRAQSCPLLPVRPYAGPVTGSRRTAINLKCRRCMGSDPGCPERIRTCSIPTCCLYPVRPYQQATDDSDHPVESESLS
jgi:hypothetical protein